MNVITLITCLVSLAVSVLALLLAAWACRKADDNREAESSCRQPQQQQQPAVQPHQTVQDWLAGCSEIARLAVNGVQMVRLYDPADPVACRGCVFSYAGKHGGCGLPRLGCPSKTFLMYAAVWDKVKARTKPAEAAAAATRPAPQPEPPPAPQPAQEPECGIADIADAQADLAECWIGAVRCRYLATDRHVTPACRVMLANSLLLTAGTGLSVTVLQAKGDPDFWHVSVRSRAEFRGLARFCVLRLVDGTDNRAGGNPNTAGARWPRRADGREIRAAEVMQRLRDSVAAWIEHARSEGCADEASARMLAMLDIERPQP